MSILKYFLTAILLGLTLVSGAQTPKSPLSRVINVSGTTQIAPSLSGDGRHMIFTSTSNLKSELLVLYSFQQRPGSWTQPVPVTTINRSLPINHIGGYSLSYDGNYIFFTSRKSYGIGKYDIWYSTRTGDNEWSPPINLAKPVNSTQDDGCPSISPDGRTLYFVRCQSMDLKEGTGCKLMVAEKRNQEIWEQPVELPAYINDGNIMSPRILADSKTLIYAKGQGDDWNLFQTRIEDGTWSKPVPLDYVNTSGDQRFASVPAQGDVLYYSTKYQGTFDIIKAKIPQELQPLKVTYLKGQVSNSAGEPMEAFIQIYDTEEKKLVQYKRTSSKSSAFEFYLAAGKKYDFSIVPLASGYAFYSEIFDLSDLAVSTRKRMNITLDELDSGASFALPCLRFENDTTLSDLSRFELSRIIKLLKNNPGTTIEISVHREAMAEDSLQQNDSTYVDESIVSDINVDESAAITESSLEVVDSVLVEEEIPIMPPPDPTEVRAATISKYLEDRGVPEYVVETKGYADSEPLVNEGSEEELLVNRRVELRIL